MLDPFLIGLFWLQVGAMLHTYVTYPASLYLFVRWHSRPKSRTGPDHPTVAILIAAYNEQDVIDRKIANTIAMRFPSQRLEVLIGSDGSTDATCAIVRQIADPRVRLFEFTTRRGKAAVLNSLAAATSADVLVFTDANAWIEPDAVDKLVRHFADPAVGAVSGGKRIQVSPNAPSVRGETLYSNFENYLKALESAAGGTSGCRGALMARRRSDFIPYRTGTINDDLVAGLETALAGKRVVFDGSACAYEECGHDVHTEFRRRVRIGAGNYQALAWYWRLFDPRRGVVAYVIISHKLIRWLFPLMMMGTAVVNALLLNRPFFRLSMSAQILFYGAALAGWLADRLRLHLPGVSAIYHFTAMNVALLCGLCIYLRGVPSGVWERTPRSLT